MRYGARVVRAKDGLEPGWWLKLAAHEWIFCVQPGEFITEGLQASLFEWSLRPADGLAEGKSFSVAVRTQTGDVWGEASAPETRLVRRDWSRWNGGVPVRDASSIPLEGEIVRLPFP